MIIIISCCFMHRTFFQKKQIAKSSVQVYCQGSELMTNDLRN